MEILELSTLTCASTSLCFFIDITPCDVETVFSCKGNLVTCSTNQVTVHTPSQMPI